MRQEGQKTVSRSEEEMWWPRKKAAFFHSAFLTRLEQHRIHPKPATLRDAVSPYTVAGASWDTRGTQKNFSKQKHKII